MAAQRNIVYPLIFAFQKALASPMPEIFPPHADTLSFAELVQKVSSCILALGFFRGIAVSLLILACLTCLLIGTLRWLAAYLSHHNTQLWEALEEVDGFEDDEKDQEDDPTSRRSSISDHLHQCNIHMQRTRNRNSGYILADSPKSVTKVKVHASAARGAVIPSPVPPPKLRFSTPNRSSSTPLRSAFCKSPPSSRRFAKAQSFVGSSRTNSSAASSPSPKSVRWADELRISVTSTIELNVRKRGDSVQAKTEAEMDVTAQTIGNRNKRSNFLEGLSPPAYEPPSYVQFPPRPAAAATEAETNSSMATQMQVEGDTS